MTDFCRRIQLWQALQAHGERAAQFDLQRSLCDRGRFAKSHLSVANLIVDWTRQLVDEPAHAQLHQLATEYQLHEFLQSVYQGDFVNWTESRAATHVTHRASFPENPSSRAMLNLADQIRNGTRVGHSGKPFTDVVNIGIGGSHLGPAMVYRALEQQQGPRLHFLTNIHSTERAALLGSLNPESTLVIVASKSYGTFETLDNARYIRQWMHERVSPEANTESHFVHITSNRDRVEHDETVLEVPNSIGGRFSLWSAMGFAVAIAFGSKVFQDLIAGARAMDKHVLETADLESNLAVKLALLGVWNTNILKTESHLILTYDPRLQLLPAYLQQLEMESNGKSITPDGTLTNRATCPIVWGGMETDGQHAFHQLLHQGTRKYSADLIISRSTRQTSEASNAENWILANAVAQSTVMFAGHQTPSNEAFMNIPGRHGSTIIVLNTLNAHNLGALVALYEHKVACLGHLWDVNSFDQWGVEAGKQLADDVYQFLQHGTGQNVPATTVALLSKIDRS